MQSSNGIDTPASSAPPPAPVAPAPAPTQSDERSFKQSEVNDIVKKAKHGAVEDYRRQAQERPEYVEQKYGERPQTYLQPAQPTMPESEIRRLAGEEAQRLRDVWVQEARTKSETDQAQRTVQQFFSKIATGKEKYQDFESVTGDIDLARFPNVVQLLAQHIDNSGDVLYELGKDRIKMANLEQLAYMSPNDAIIQAQRFAKSLADNDASGKVRTPNEPLTQMRPSNTGTDNGAMSVKDYRSKYRV